MRLAHHMMTWNGWYRKQEKPVDVPRVLQEVKAAGYEGIEMGGDESTLGKPAELKQLLADVGLELAAWATNVTANPWPPNTEQYQRAMDYAAAMGVSTIMVCGGFLGEKRRTTFESDYELFGENMGYAMEYARSNGQSIAYHPHVGCIIETLAEMQKLWKYVPDLEVCIDTGHLIAVREDPIEFMRYAPAKVIHIHLKDWDPEAATFTELGEGKAGLDFGKILKTLDEIGYQGWLAVERDNVQMEPIESAKMSRAFLRQFE